MSKTYTPNTRRLVNQNFAERRPQAWVRKIRRVKYLKPTLFSRCERWESSVISPGTKVLWTNVHHCGWSLVCGRRKGILLLKLLVRSQWHLRSFLLQWIKHLYHCMASWAPHRLAFIFLLLLCRTSAALFASTTRRLIWRARACAWSSGSALSRALCGVLALLVH